MRTDSPLQVREDERPFSNTANATSEQALKNQMLIEAVCAGDQEQVEQALKNGANVNCQMGSGKRSNPSPLHVAAESGNIAIAELLLGASAEIEATERAYQFTPLLCAADKAHFEMLCLLINRGANGRVRDWLGRTPLHFAARGEDKTEERIKIIEKLLEQGADVNAWSQDSDFRTPLDGASQEVIQQLLRARGGRLGKEIRFCHLL
ncbi:MAG: ankyrin repeat domain-containing protein [Roseivirga sp.]